MDTSAAQQAPAALPKLSEERKGQIALAILTDRILSEVQPFNKPNGTRRALAATCRRLKIDPNEGLSLLESMLRPKLDEVLRPISEDELKKLSQQNKGCTTHHQVHVVRSAPGA